MCVLGNHDYDGVKLRLSIFLPGPSSWVVVRVCVCCASDVSKSFGDKLLVENMNFSVPPGAVVGIIGGNGAGEREGGGKHH